MGDGYLAPFDGVFVSAFLPRVTEASLLELSERCDGRLIGYDLLLDSCWGPSWISIKFTNLCVTVITLILSCLLYCIALQWLCWWMNVWKRSNNYCSLLLTAVTMMPYFFLNHPTRKIIGLNHMWPLSILMYYLFFCWIPINLFALINWKVTPYANVTGAIRTWQTNINIRHIIHMQLLLLFNNF